MDRTPTTWLLERHHRVRADAEGIFAPVSDLPDAAPGDIVVATSAEGGEARRGTIVDVTTRDGEPYVRIAFDE